MVSLPRSPRASIEIDCAALRHNLIQVKKLVPDAAVMAVVKANAYGHGMDLVAGVLADSLGSSDQFAVCDFCDVDRLRRAKISHSITTFSAQLGKDQVDEIGHAVTPTIFDHSQLAVLKNAKLKSPINVWLKVDTGMGRLGFLGSEVGEVLGQLRSIAGITQIGLMTHLANADDPTASANIEQLKQTAELAKNHVFDGVSIFNSGGVCGAYEATNWGASHWVRPGLMLYGASPLRDKTANELGLQAVMRFSSKLISVRDMPAGSAIGYGGTVKLEKDSRIGVVACGYGDGYPRHAETGTPVFVNGKLCPLLGRVSMDMISVDLDSVEAQVGDEAVLWGAENPIETVAQHSATIPYTLMCGITERVQRTVKNG